LYFIFSWFSYSKFLSVFQSAPMVNLSPIVPFTFIWTSCLKSGSLRVLPSKLAVTPWEVSLLQAPWISTAPPILKLITGGPNILRNPTLGKGISILVISVNNWPKSFCSDLSSYLYANCSQRSLSFAFSLSLIYSSSGILNKILGCSPAIVSFIITKLPVESSETDLVKRLEDG
jgi:hypothetical protein